jgi:cytoskeletal protein CcmA (bactofilin family)
MTETTLRVPRTRLSSLLLTLLLATAAGAQPPQPPSIPEPPEPPSPPELSVQGFTIKAGETHKGNVVRFAPSIAIEGTLDGDMYTTSQTVRISGVVTGDVFVAGGQIDLTGTVEKSFRAAAANVVIDGTVQGNVLVTGGSLTLGSKAHVQGSVSAYTGQFTHHGVIDGSLTFTGGTAILSGKVQEDANLTADALAVEPGARVEGDIEYSTRKPMDAELKAITGGDVTYNEKPVQERKKRETTERSVGGSKFSIGVRIAFFTAAFLFGCALLAVFSAHEPKVTAAIRTDALRCAGTGFVSILVTIAVCLSMILIITIPFVAIYLVAYVVAVYLAKIPVAIWLGRIVLEKIRPSSGPYLALFVGLILLSIVFMIPVLGVLAWIFSALLGLGAMTMTYLAHREAKKAAVVAA